MCSNIPVNLKLTSSDNDLFASTKPGKWAWDPNVLYWSVQCLVHRQNSVSPIIVPNITPDQFKPVNMTDITWDFCSSSQNKGSGCDPSTEFLLIVFSFNPASTNPNDFEQFVIDVNGTVTYHAPNSLTYGSTPGQGPKVKLDIERVDRSYDNSLLEIWLTKGSGAGILLYSTPSLGAFGPEPARDNIILTSILVLLSLIMIGVLVGIIYFA